MFLSNADGFFFPAGGGMWQKEPETVPPTLRNSHPAYRLQPPLIVNTRRQKIIILKTSIYPSEHLQHNI